MQGRGFEPLKAEPAGLQPAPFGHSGTPARLRSVARPPQTVTTSRATRARLPTVALLAQLVEHLHGKEGVAGSSPAEGFTKRREGLSRRLTYGRRVSGRRPASGGHHRDETLPTFA